MFRIAVCDDDIEFLDLLKSMTYSISEETEYNLEIDIQCFNSGQHLIDDLLRNNRYEIIMLDWEMPELNGEATGKAIRALDQSCLIIFITAFSNYAIQASKLTMFRYIVKDKLIDELPEALLSAYNKELFNKKTMKIIDTGKINYLVKVKDIIYVENQCAKTTITIRHNVKIIVSRSFLSENSNYFLQNGFVKPYRGILINSREISKLTRDHVVMSDGSSIPISRHSKHDVYFKVREIMENEI